MAEPAPKLDDEPALPRKKRSQDIVRQTHTDELVIALCGPMGAPLHLVADLLQSLLLDKHGYRDCRIIKLSSFIEEKAAPGEIDNSSKYNRRKSLIEAGNKLRDKYGSAVLAEMAIREISIARTKRQAADGIEDHHKPYRVCHIIDSIKNREELEILRLVYKDMLHCIGVISPLHLREHELLKDGMRKDDFYELVDRDSGEEKQNGQTVRETFPQSDVFIRVDSDVEDPIREKADRYLGLILNSNMAVPTREENAMYMAAAAAVNSACLSRQVGAAITNPTGEVLGIGWNDVPQSGGGLYGSQLANEREKDKRCKNLHHRVCYNDREKRAIAGDAVQHLITSGLIPEAKRKEAQDALMGTRVRDLLEFSRAVHAEMHAIISVSQKAGSQMRGGKIFCTTYPCHYCAGHIVMAGLAEVYYIEPYRKSLATVLHFDAITEDTARDGKVKLIPYEGVAPTRFHSLFTALPNSRKKSGQKVSPDPKVASLKEEISLESLPRLEAAVVANLKANQLA